MGRISLNGGPRVASCAIVVLLCIGVASARAATLTVNTTVDETTSSAGVCSLREAISAVNTPGTATTCGTASTSGNTILLGARTYPLTLGVPAVGGGTPPPGCTAGGAHTDDNTAGDLTVFGTVRNLTIEGAGTTASVIDACKLGDRALNILAGAKAVTVRDLTIEDGRAVKGKGGGTIRLSGASGNPGGPGDNGGGMLNSGSLTLMAVEVTGNEAGQGGNGGSGHAGTGGTAGGNGGDAGAGGEGGGIYNDTTGSLTLIDSTVAGNTAGVGGSGGGGGKSDEANGGSGGSGGAGGDGGGVESVGQLTVTDSTISANGAGGGGTAGAGNAAGTAGTGGGGGNGGAGGAGGGIAAEGGSLAITNSTIEGNVAGTATPGAPAGDGPTDGVGGVGGSGGDGGDGGGLLLEALSSSTVLNATVAGNAVGSGEAAAADGNPAPTETGSAGSDGIGGGAFVAPTAPTTFTNTLLASNGSVGNCATVAMTPITGVFTDGGHNIDYATPPTTTLPANQLCPTTFGRGNPELGPLQNNLGPTPTMALGAGSAAINQIPPGSDCPATDQRGFKRPSGPECDIGAYEVTPPAISAEPATAITTTAATIHGEVTANQVHATVRFQFGKTTAYGSQTAIQTVGGATAVAIAAHLTGLKPHTDYHYRLLASSSDGTSKSADATFTTQAVPPVITGLKITPAQFKTGKPGAAIKYSDSGAAKTTFEILSVEPGIKQGEKCVRPGKSQKGKACTRLVKVASFVHTDTKGKDSVHFSGAIGKRVLAPGRYYLEATPQLNGATGKTVTVGFKIMAKP